MPASPAPRRLNLWWSSRARAGWLIVLGVIGVVTGAYWRWQHLDTRPLHADEAVQAWQTWQLLRGEGYRYDPVDRHGPWLYFGAAAWERLRGGDAGTLTDARVRTFVWLAGVATLALLAFAAAPLIGRTEAAVATGLLAVAPLAVLYHTYFVQEAWLTLFTWALLFTGLAWWQQPRPRLALLAGVLVGLMQVTKETSVLHYAALALAFLTTARAAPPPLAPALAAVSLSRRARWQQAALAVAAAAVVYAAFYSSFGRHPRGLVDGVVTYLHQWQRSGDDAHTQPFTYYLGLLWPHRAGGVSWGEPWLLALAGGGAVLAWWRPATLASRPIAVFTVSLLLIYSAIPYKTPWLLLTPLVGLILLAAHTVATLARQRYWGLALAVVVTTATLLQLMNQTKFSLERLPGDERNPYFYQQAPRGFLALPRRVKELEAATGRPPVVAVVSPDYAWPVPWYLRELPNAGYFTSPPETLAPFDVVIWDTQVPPPDAWPTDAIVELHGLRPNVLLYLVIRPELWRQWEAAR